MEIEITLKNYRCFPDTNPARITLRDGFTSLVGANNAGKSSILGFFYEFRTLFQSWSSNNSLVLEAFQERPTYQALAPLQKREDLSPMWGKTENWRIAREMTLEELRATDLGQFLEKI